MRQLPFLFMLIFMLACSRQPEGNIITVNGIIPPQALGKTLEHEHILVDFSGAENYHPENYNRQEAFNRILPELEKLKHHGVQSFIACTPQFVGRDVVLLKNLADATGLNILTNTGFYGAQNNKFIPKHVFDMPAEAIAAFYIAEFEQGIEASGVRPGFIKTAVDRKPLSNFHVKLVRAAAIAHKATGLTIMSHTGPALPAFQQLKILSAEGVAPEAFIWTHASDEEDWTKLVTAAQMGAWISLDKYGWDEEFLKGEVLGYLKKQGVLDKVLISHDAGWYDPNQPGKTIQPYTPIFETLIPNLKANDFTAADIDQLLIHNPAKAFTVTKRLISQSN
ncbi:phosphotriesterase family protein [uncultured Sunxiuqinia sp.]|uniref:phosphotriesterase family protein n=1 Tax=Sunxiuqinia rutila TaxID=1397841 RepID=UPI0026248614|nr:phosphotriesterase [uncultured Sunxiuqinia sp.]